MKSDSMSLLSLKQLLRFATMKAYCCKPARCSNDEHVTKLSHSFMKKRTKVNAKKGLIYTNIEFLTWCGKSLKSWTTRSSQNALLCRVIWYKKFSPLHQRPSQVMVSPNSSLSFVFVEPEKEDSLFCVMKDLLKLASIRTVISLKTSTDSPCSSSTRRTNALSKSKQ